MADETATLAGERMMKLAVENYCRDRRLAALVDSAVHQAMEEYGRIEADTRPERAAHDIARAAVTLALTTAFEGDAELKYTREMLAKVIAQLEASCSLVPVRLMAVDA